MPGERIDNFMRRASQQIIAASPADIRSNRLGLLSQAQLQALETQVADFHESASRFARRALLIALAATAGVVALAFARILALPIALGIELLVVAVMVYATSDCNRFARGLELDREAQAVRIIRGRASPHAMIPHPFYAVLRVELQTYKLLDAGIARQFTAGALYQFYVLPHTLLIVGAESVEEQQGAGVYG